jgi:hypothetical protein
VGILRFQKWFDLDVLAFELNFGADILEIFGYFFQKLGEN